MHGVLATTYFVAPVIVVNGPIRRAIDLNCGGNLFGQGFRANATIGRALQLVVRNIGGGKPGGVDMSTLGQPGKFTCCVGELEDEFLAGFVEQGESLEDHRQRRGVISWPELLPLMDQLCSAVDYAHSKKIVHRDIKPANILINQDRDIKLADFGVARTIVTSTFTHGMTTDSSNSQLAGTMIFMSPQVLMGGKPSPDDDIYAIGVTLYFLLTGFVPFFDENLQTLANQICNHPAQPIDKVISEQGISSTIPEHICAAIMACLSKTPDHRPKKARLITANYS